MKRELFAKALGEGVEAAYRFEFDEAVQLIERLDLVSGDSTLEGIGEAHWVVSPIQLLEDYQGGPAVELLVEVTDGFFDESVHVYVRKFSKEAQSARPSDSVDAINREVKRMREGGNQF